MISIRARLNWPLFVVLFIALFIWLVRDPGSSSRQAVQSTQRRPRPDRPAQARPARTVIFTGDADRESADRITYAEALRSGRYSPEELETIGNREAMEAGFDVYEQAQHLHVSMPTPNWRK